VLVDGAQAVGHLNVDVRALDADFYVFSGHKMFGPSGVGVFYGKASRLESMPPWQGGGDMIRSVSFERTEFDGLPARFEAGTPNIEGAIGLGAAIDYINQLGVDRIAAQEHQLLEYATERMEHVAGLHLLGSSPSKSAILTFVIDNVHPHDVGTVLDDLGIAVRTGHHCCQPLLCRLGVEVASRASLAFYNTKDEIDVFIDGLRRIAELFG
jgi:cysteine desulfurase/selenocysteine lyase